MNNSQFHFKCEFPFSPEHATINKMSASARYDFAIGTLFGYFDAAQIVYCLC